AELPKEKKVDKEAIEEAVEQELKALNIKNAGLKVKIIESMINKKFQPVIFKFLANRVRNMQAWLDERRKEDEEKGIFDATKSKIGIAEVSNEDMLLYLDMTNSDSRTPSDSVPADAEAGFSRIQKALRKIGAYKTQREKLEDNVGNGAVYEASKQEIEGRLQGEMSKTEKGREMLEEHETMLSRYLSLEKQGFKNIGNIVWKTTILITLAFTLIGLFVKYVFYKDEQRTNLPGPKKDKKASDIYPTLRPDTMALGHAILSFFAKAALFATTFGFTLYFLALFNLSFISWILVAGFTVPIFYYLTRIMVMLLIERIMTFPGVYPLIRVVLETLTSGKANLVPSGNLQEVPDTYTGNRKIMCLWPVGGDFGGEKNITSLLAHFRQTLGWHREDRNVCVGVIWKVEKTGSDYKMLCDGIKKLQQEFGDDRVYFFYRQASGRKPRNYQYITAWLNGNYDLADKDYFNEADSLGDFNAIRNETRGRSKVPYLFITDFGDYPGPHMLTKLSKKMAHKKNKDFVLFQPRMRYHNADDSIWTKMHWVAQDMLWFTQEGLFRIFGRAQPFGKFGIKTEIYNKYLLEGGEKSVWLSLDKDSYYVESHDYMEGSFLRCALVNDATMYESSPSSPLREETREAKWRRFDVKILTKFLALITLLTIPITYLLSAPFYLLGFLGWTKAKEVAGGFTKFATELWAERRLLPNQASARWTSQISRGISSDPLFSIFLIIGWVAVIVPGLQEMLYQFGGEYLFLIIMTLLIVIPKYIAPLIDRMRNIENQRRRIMEGIDDGGIIDNMLRNFANTRLVFYLGAFFLHCIAWILHDIWIITGELVLSTIIFLNKLFLSPKTIKQGTRDAYRQRIGLGRAEWIGAGEEGPNLPLREFLFAYKVPFTFAISIGLLFVLGLFEVGWIAGGIIGIIVGILTAFSTSFINIPARISEKNEALENYKKALEEKKEIKKAEEKVEEARKKIKNTWEAGIIIGILLSTLGMLSPALSAYIPFHWFLRFMPLYLAFLMGPFVSWFAGEKWGGKSMAGILIWIIGFASVVFGLALFGGFTGAGQPIAVTVFLGDGIAPLPIMSSPAPGLKPFSFAYQLGIPRLFTLLHTTIAGGAVVMAAIGITYGLIKGIPYFLGSLIKSAGKLSKYTRPKKSKKQPPQQHPIKSSKLNLAASIGLGITAAFGIAGFISVFFTKGMAVTFAILSGMGLAYSIIQGITALFIDRAFVKSNVNIRGPDGKEREIAHLNPTGQIEYLFVNNETRELIYSPEEQKENYTRILDNLPLQDISILRILAIIIKGLILAHERTHLITRKEFIAYALPWIGLFKKVEPIHSPPVTFYRPGYYGKKRSETEKMLNRWYGKGNWQERYMIAGKLISKDERLKYYEDAYYYFFLKNPDELERLLSQASDVYDNDPSNVESGFDYNIQETTASHLQDIAIRRVVRRLGKEFRGNRLVQIRGGTNSEFAHLNPGDIPFHQPELIPEPHLKGWWQKDSIEDFYQSTKVIALTGVSTNAIKDAVEKGESRLFAITGRKPDAPELALIDFDDTLISANPTLKQSWLEIFWMLMNPESAGKSRPSVSVLEKLRKLPFFAKNQPKIFIAADIIGYITKEKGCSVEDIIKVAKDIAKRETLPVREPETTIAGIAEKLQKDPKDISMHELLENIAEKTGSPIGNIQAFIDGALKKAGQSSENAAIVLEAIEVINSYLYNSWIEKTLDTENMRKKVYPGAKDFLVELNQLFSTAQIRTAVVSAGSRCRVMGMARAADLDLATLCPLVIARNATDRLFIGNEEYKKRVCQEIGKGLKPKQVIVFDDSRRIIKEMHDLGFITIGLVDSSEKIEKMINAGADYILTHNFRAMNEKYNMFTLNLTASKFGKMADERRIINIDGFARAGKSATASMVAERLGGVHFDKGMLYRAYTWKALRNPEILANPEELAEMVRTTVMEYRNERIYIDGKDITDELYIKEINDNVAKLGRRTPAGVLIHDKSNRILIELLQRNTYPIVITRASLTESILNIFLTATLEERVGREVFGFGREDRLRDVDIEAIEEQILARDRADGNKMKYPGLFIEIDSTGKTVEQVCSQIVEMAEKALTAQRSKYEKARELLQLFYEDRAEGQKGTLSTIFLKGGKMGGKHKEVKSQILGMLTGLGFEIAIIPERDITLKDALEIWGPKGIKAIIKSIGREESFKNALTSQGLNPDKFIENWLRRVDEVHTGEFESYLKQASVLMPDYPKVQKLPFLIDYLKEGGQHLLLKRLIDRKYVISTLKEKYGVSKEDLQDIFGAENPLEMDEQDFTKKLAEILRKIVTKALKEGVLRNVFRKARSLGIKEAIIYRMVNGIHAPSTDELAREISLMNIGEIRSSIDYIKHAIGTRASPLGLAPVPGYDLSSYYETQLPKRIYTREEIAALLKAKTDQLAGRIDTQTLYGKLQYYLLLKRRDYLVEEILYDGPDYNYYRALIGITRLIPYIIEQFPQDDYVNILLARDGGIYHMADKILSGSKAKTRVFHLSRRNLGDSHSKMKALIEETDEAIRKDKDAYLAALLPRFTSLMRTDRAFREKAHTFYVQLKEAGILDGKHHKFRVSDCWAHGIITTYLMTLITFFAHYTIDENGAINERETKEDIDVDEFLVIPKNEQRYFGRFDWKNTGLTRKDIDSWYEEEGLCAPDQELDHFLENIASQVYIYHYPHGEVNLGHPVSWNRVLNRLDISSAPRQLSAFLRELLVINSVLRYAHKRGIIESFPDEDLPVFSSALDTGDSIGGTINDFLHQIGYELKADEVKAFDELVMLNNEVFVSEGVTFDENDQLIFMANLAVLIKMIGAKNIRKALKKQRKNMIYNRRIQEFLYETKIWQTKIFEDVLHEILATIKKTDPRKEFIEKPSKFEKLIRNRRISVEEFQEESRRHYLERRRYQRGYMASEDKRKFRNIILTSRNIKQSLEKLRKSEELYEMFPELDEIRHLRYDEKAEGLTVIEHMFLDLANLQILEDASTALESNDIGLFKNNFEKYKEMSGKRLTNLTINVFEKIVKIYQIATSRGEDKILVWLLMLLRDVGKSVSWPEHAFVGRKLISAILRQYDYSEDRVKLAGLIIEHKGLFDKLTLGELTPSILRKVVGNIKGQEQSLFINMLTIINIADMQNLERVGKLSIDKLNITLPMVNFANDVQKLTRIIEKMPFERVRVWTEKAGPDKFKHVKHIIDTELVKEEKEVLVRFLREAELQDGYAVLSGLSEKALVNALYLLSQIYDSIARTPRIIFSSRKPKELAADINRFNSLMDSYSIQDIRDKLKSAASPKVEEIMQSLGLSVKLDKRLSIYLYAIPLASTVKRDLINQVLRHYNLGKLVRAELLTGGRYASTKPVLMATTKGKYVLKPFQGVEERVEYEHFLMNFLHNRGFPCVEVIPTKDGETYIKISGIFYSIHKFTEGKVLRWGDIKGTKLRKAASVQALLHKLTKGLRIEGEGSPYPSALDVDVAKITPEVYKSKHRAALRYIEALAPEDRTPVHKLFLQNHEMYLQVCLDELAKLRANLPEAILNKLPKCIIHRDYYSRNIIWQGDEIVAVLDWETAGEGHRVYDLANEIIIDALSSGRTDLDVDKIVAYVEVYQDAAGSNRLTAEEIKAFPEMLREKALRLMINRFIYAVGQEDKRGLTAWPALVKFFEDLDRYKDEIIKRCSIQSSQQLTEAKLRHLALIRERKKETAQRDYVIFKNLVLKNDNILRALEELKDSGKLFKMFPEFAEVDNKHYPQSVDGLSVVEHTFLLLASLQMLEDASRALRDKNDSAFKKSYQEYKRTSGERLAELTVEMFKELVDKYEKSTAQADDKVLTWLSSLLHDIGKAVSWSEHLPMGAKLIRPILEQFGLPEERVKLGELVIGYHGFFGELTLGEMTLLTLRRLMDNFEKDTQQLFLNMLTTINIADIKSLGKKGRLSVKKKLNVILPAVSAVTDKQKLADAVSKSALERLRIWAREADNGKFERIKHILDTELTPMEKDSLFRHLEVVELEYGFPLLSQLGDGEIVKTVYLLNQICRFIGYTPMIVFSSETPGVKKSEAAAFNAWIGSYSIQDIRDRFTKPAGGIEEILQELGLSVRFGERLVIYSGSVTSRKDSKKSRTSPLYGVRLQQEQMKKALRDPENEYFKGIVITCMGGMIAERLIGLL
ncbi:MAG: (d)CMP kinase, partial [Candidatus Omnitrophota bacterium]